MVRPCSVFMDAGNCIEGCQAAMLHVGVNPINAGCPPGGLEGHARLKNLTEVIVTFEHLMPVGSLMVSLVCPFGGVTFPEESVPTTRGEVEVAQDDRVGSGVHVVMNLVHVLFPLERFIGVKVASKDIKTQPFPCDQFQGQASARDDLT